MELALTTIIIASVAAIAMPRYGQALARFEAAAAARRVVAEVDRARQHARASSRQVILTFDTNADTLTNAGLPDPDRPGQPYRVELNAAPYRADLTGATFGGGVALAFDGYGVPEKTGSVTLTRGDITRTVLIDGAGKAVVE